MTTSTHAIGEFKPRHMFFIGIDSDGTAFNSMEVKQKRVFLPIAVEMWGLQPVEKEFYEIAEFVNLYSVHRGVNRFQALAMTFALLQERATARGEGMKLPAFSSLQDFVRSGRPLSTDSLVEYNRTKADAFLAQVTEWSKRSDEQYARITRAEGNPPYPQVRPVLERAARVADIMIVSSSTHKALMQDWADTQLLALLSLVAGQEIGSKATQLEFAVKGNYEPHRTLMIGDAPGDLEAARSNHVMFYPIIPGQETQSWERFLDEGFDRFVRERYAGDYERRLLSEFENMLLSPERPLRA